MIPDQITRIDKIIAVLEAAKKEWSIPQYFYNQGWVEVGEGSLVNNLFYHLSNNKEVRVLMPSKPTKPSISAKDWEGQPMVWVRTKAPGADLLVLVITGYSFQVCNSMDYRFDSTTLDSYSFDRITWHSFTKEVPGEMKVVASTQ